MLKDHHIGLPIGEGSATCLEYKSLEQFMAPARPELVPVEQTMSGVSMEVVGHKPKSWFLLAEGKKYYLDVSCAISGCSFSLLIKLTAKECMDYKTQGLPFIQGIAQKIQRSPTAYYGENQSIQTQSRVFSAITAYMRMKER
jgi:hypothetical protein